MNYNGYLIVFLVSFLVTFIVIISKSSVEVTCHEYANVICYEKPFSISCVEIDTVFGESCEYLVGE